MSPGLAIFVLVVIVVVGWFALGTHINVRKGHQYLEWLQGGLPLIGEKTTVRWLGSSVVQLKIEKAREPFRRAEILIVLEPRDVPLMWFFSRLHARRDLLIVRTELRTEPQVQLEVLDGKAWSTRAVAREVKQQNWPRQSPFQAPGDHRAFQVYSPLATDAHELLSEASRCELPLVRLGVRRTNRSLEMQWRLPSRPASISRAVMEAVQRVAYKL